MSMRPVRSVLLVRALAALLLALAAPLLCAQAPGTAATPGQTRAAPPALRVASAFDPQTMDPHALALLYHTRVSNQIYESLVTRDEQFRLEPGLALSWQMTSPTSWRFKLRPNVVFHDGTGFSADDAVFSIERALAAPSQRAFQLKGVTAVKRVDALTIDLLLELPDAVLPEKMQFIGMMSRAWCDKHGVQKAQDYNGKQETFAVRNANGTGPFRLDRYEPDVRTLLKRNPQWWGWADAKRNGNAADVSYTTIKSDATRLAALASGEVDMVLDPPFQDIDRLKRDTRIALLQMPDIGQQYFTFDQSRDELQDSDVKGRNPFKDIRVRRAVYHALNIDLIVQKVLRGQAVPTGGFLSTRVDGSPAELDRRLPYDPAQAKALLAEAGYANGFSVTLDCVNVAWREAVCQAAAAMLTQVGIRTTLRSSPTSQFFPKLTQGSGSFVEFGWTPGTDAWAALNALVHLGQVGPRHLQRRPLQQPEARHADRRDARRARHHAPARDGCGGAAPLGRGAAVRAAVPAHDHLGDGEDRVGRPVAGRHPRAALGAGALTGVMPYSVLHFQREAGDMLFITTKDKTQLYVKDWGNGPPVILLHGWPLSSDSWDDQAMALASAGHRVIAYDRRGFGRSGQPWSGYDYDTLADDLAAVIEHTGVQDTALVGFSMGGGEVARYMSRHGGRGVTKAALVASVVPYMLKTADNPDGVDQSVFDDIGKNIREDRAKFFAGFMKDFYGIGLISQPTSSEQAHASWTVAMQASLKATLDCAVAFASTDFRPDLASFRCPTLIIHGTGDKTVPIDASGRAAARGIAGAQLIEYDGSPHGLLATDKERVSADLVTFLAR